MKICTGRNACLSLIMLTCIHVPYRSKSQIEANKTISITPGIYTYREVFREIERQTKMYFVYTDLVLNDTMKTFASFHDVPLYPVLEFLLHPKSIGFTTRRKAIVLFRRETPWYLERD